MSIASPNKVYKQFFMAIMQAVHERLDRTVLLNWFYTPEMQRNSQFEMSLYLSIIISYKTDR